MFTVDNHVRPVPSLICLFVTSILLTGCASDPCLDDGWVKGECFGDGDGDGDTDTHTDTDTDTDTGDGDGDGDGDGCTGDGDGCTLTQGYWKNHDDWPLEQSSESCGLTWIEILHTPTHGDPWFILAHQYIAAELNVASGASMSTSTRRALDDASELLASCGCHEDGDDSEDALALSKLLDDYNNGELGPGHCD